VTLNINATLKTKLGKGARKASVKAAKLQAIVDAVERPLVREVLDEMSAWNPREFITAFQRWHQGAISLVHLNVLTILEAGGPLSMSALAESLDISVASVTGVVDRMEARGLVKRKRRPDDRRVIEVHPAAGGRKVFGEIDRRRRQGLAMLLGKLGDDELSGLLTGHRALRAARRGLFEQSKDEQT
jgi:DNA-binding MarR family transcriptional regulator